MKDEYFKYYILSYFDIDKVTTESQIIHVIHAKRTPSMFYLIESNGWHHGFSLSDKISRQQLSRIIKVLLVDDYLIGKDQGYVLTEKGQIECTEYFKQHYYPQKIKGFFNAKIRKAFGIDSSYLRKLFLSTVTKTKNMSQLLNIHIIKKMSDNYFNNLVQIKNNF